MKINKHHIIGLILILTFIVIAWWVLVAYQKSSHPYLRRHQAAAIEPMTREELYHASPSFSPQSPDSLLEQHFQRKTPPMPIALPVAWVVKVTRSMTEEEVKKWLTRLRALHFDSFRVPVEGQSLQQLYVGPFLEQQEAVNTINTLRQSLKIDSVLEQYKVEQESFYF